MKASPGNEIRRMHYTLQFLPKTDSSEREKEMIAGVCVKY